MDYPINGKNEDIRYAGFWVRLAGGSIDGLVIGFLQLIILTIIVKLIYTSLITGLYIKFILAYIFGMGIIVPLLYFSWFNANARQTVGKKIFGIAVRDGAFNPISFWRSVSRTIFLFISNIVLSIGYLIIPLNKRKKAFHDFISKSVVIRVRSRMRFEWIFIAVVLAGSYFLVEYEMAYLRGNFIQAFSIQGRSAEPSLLAGDHIIVDKYSPVNPPLKPGEWVVYRPQRHPDKIFVKRSIAAGGQTLQIKSGRVYVDGKPETRFFNQNHDAEREQPSPETPVDNSIPDYGPATVPPDQYFVVDDDLRRSYDSRHHGSVEAEAIVGRGAYIYFSMDPSTGNIRYSRIGTYVE